VINSPSKILIKRFIIYIAILVGKKSRIYLTKKNGKKNSMKESKSKVLLNVNVASRMLHFVIITYYDISIRKLTNFKNSKANIILDEIRY
jgi:hypothetical protein